MFSRTCQHMLLMCKTQKNPQASKTYSKCLYHLAEEESLLHSHLIPDFLPSPITVHFQLYLPSAGKQCCSVPLACPFLFEIKEEERPHFRNMLYCEERKRHNYLEKKARVVNVQCKASCVEDDCLYGGTSFPVEISL